MFLHKAEWECGNARRSAHTTGANANLLRSIGLAWCDVQHQLQLSSHNDPCNAKETAHITSKFQCTIPVWRVIDPQQL